MEKPERKPISKTLRALSWLAESSASEVGVRQLAAAMKIAPSTAHRILLALSEAGFVRQNGRTQRYTLGLEFLRLSQLAIAKAPLHEAGMQAMRRLVESCRESALLVIYDDVRQEMIFAGSAESTQSLPRTIELNKWIPLRTGASGLAILAFLRSAEAQCIIRRIGLASQLHRAFSAPDCLEDELAGVRQQGYAVTRCQLMTGAVGLAAPIFNSNGRVAGDICVTIPAQRFGDESKDRLVDALLRCASEVTNRIRGVRQNFALA